MTIQTTSTRVMNKFINNLKNKGYKIKNCALIGHGDKKTHHIGVLDNLDVNIDERIKKRDQCESEIEDVNEKITTIRGKLKEQKNSPQFEKLKERMEQLTTRHESLKEQHNELSDKVTELEGLNDAFAPGAIISAVNCFAGSETDHQLMTNLGRVFLSKNGGSVIGFDSKIYLNPKQFEWGWLRDLTGGDLFTVTWGHPVIVNIPQGSYPQTGSKKKKNNGGGGGSAGTGEHHGENHTAKPTPCNGHNHKGNCHCGWGGTK